MSNESEKLLEKQTKTGRSSEYCSKQFLGSCGYLQRLEKAIAEKDKEIDGKNIFIDAEKPVFQALLESRNNMEKLAIANRKELADLKGKVEVIQSFLIENQYGNLALPQILVKWYEIFGESEKNVEHH